MSELDLTIPTNTSFISNQGKKYRIKVNLNEKKKRTTIVLSHRNRERVFQLGKYGETYDDIIDKLVSYDIKISNP